MHHNLRVQLRERGVEGDPGPPQLPEATVSKVRRWPDFVFGEQWQSQRVMAHIFMVS